MCFAKKITLFYTQAELKRQARAFFAKKNRFANARLVPLHGIRIAGALVVFQGVGQG